MTNYTPNQVSVILPKVGDKLEVIGSSPRYDCTDSGGFMMFFVEGLERISHDKDLVGRDLRVYLALCAKANKDNKICISQRELGDSLGIDPSEISKSTLRLNELNYLTIVDRIGKQNVYMLNPEVIYKDSKDKRAKAIQEYNNPLNLPKVAVKRVKQLFSKTEDKVTDSGLEVPY